MSNHSPNRVQAGVRQGGQFTTGARPESSVDLQQPGDAPTCAECAGPVEVTVTEVTHHLTEDGQYDYDSDADHVALPDDGYGDIIYGGGVTNTVMSFEIDGAEGHYEVDRQGDSLYSVFRVDGDHSEQVVSFDRSR